MSFGDEVSDEARRIRKLGFPALVPGPAFTRGLAVSKAEGVPRKVYTLFSPFEVDRSRIERIIDPVDPSRDVKDPVASSYGPNPCP